MSEWESEKKRSRRERTFVNILSLMKAASRAPVISTVFRVSASEVTRNVTLSPGLPRVPLLVGDVKESGMDVVGDWGNAVRSGYERVGT